MSDPEGPYQWYKGGICFRRACPSCGRIVKADDGVMVNGLEEVSDAANATCSKCGRVTMDFLGYLGDGDDEE